MCVALVVRTHTVARQTRPRKCRNQALSVIHFQDVGVIQNTLRAKTPVTHT